MPRTGGAPKHAYEIVMCIRGGVKSPFVAFPGPPATSSTILAPTLGSLDIEGFVRINYPYRVIYIRFVGTHQEYDGIDAETI